MQLFEIVQRYNKILHYSKEKILTILTRIETWQTAEDELARTINCFENLERMQSRYLSIGTVASITSFLPLNQPLYSFVLFVVVPSFTSEKVFFRPPLLLWDLFTELIDIFDIIALKTITMCKVSRSYFLENYVSHSDVVIFTGKYENALIIQNHLKEDSLLLFNGGALNPMIITESANLDTAVHDVIRDRLFNSGQDCMAPCAILLNRKISDMFFQKLFNDLKKEVVGKTALPETTIGQMIDCESIVFTKKMIETYSPNLIYGGKYDEKNRTIEPTVFLFDSVQLLPQELIFAPLFFIGVFDTFSEISDYLSTNTAQDLNGYISIYTNKKSDEDWIRNYCKQVLVNESLFVFESANKEFGGYGKRCSFILRNGRMQIRPLLISREIASAFYIIDKQGELL